MKRIIRSTLVWLLSMSGAASLYRWYSHRQGPLVRVVCFHDIHDAAWFERTITALVSRYHILTPQEFHSRLYDSSRINILITFDDGYDSWVSVVLPILERHHVKALFFVLSQLVLNAHDVAKTDRFMREQLWITPRAPLTLEGLRRLHASGHCIGGHTCSHSELTSLSVDEAFQDIVDDKSSLESLLGISIADFAYPFGTRRHFSPAHEHMAAEAGYTYRYTAEPGFFNADANETSIPRTLIDEGQSEDSVVRFVEGSYDLFVTLKYLCVR